MWPSWVFGIFGPRNRFPRINGPKRSPKGAQKEPQKIRPQFSTLTRAQQNGHLQGPPGTPQNGHPQTGLHTMRFLVAPGKPGSSGD